MSVAVVLADYGNEQHGEAIIGLLDAYARDPMGGGQPLSSHTKTNLVSSLAALPYAFTFLAFDEQQPVGLVNCLEGFSTFACRPLVNIHDIAVLPQYRGRGVGSALLAAVEAKAKDLGCCKLTLEVLSNNRRAKAVYQKFGFVDYALDPAVGTALFWEKKL